MTIRNFFWSTLHQIVRLLDNRQWPGTEPDRDGCLQTIIDELRFAASQAGVPFKIGFLTN